MVISFDKYSEYYSKDWCSWKVKVQLRLCHWASAVELWRARAKWSDIGYIADVWRCVASCIKKIIPTELAK